MWKRVLLTAATGALCAGGSCGVVTTNVPLDLASATIVISGLATSSEAMVVATITDAGGSAGVVLGEGQAVSVNGLALSGPSAAGAYARTIPAAASYTITVNEPTRGVADTVVTPPRPFAVTAPTAGGTASLSGFTITWTDPDPALRVGVRISQTLRGETVTKSFGPFTDTGSLVLSHGELTGLWQGADLLLVVTKIKEQVGILGFQNGVVKTELSHTMTVTPGA